ncbi:hypothetical protein [Frankia sp. Cr1]|uniref:hypothetical protein n=1 Tax=Frankia sp. Cr1 TaxID=3073931 RepID=UPI002AD41AAD|nr:hypothetical protein [Frankia sp. Cr1]
MSTATMSTSTATMSTHRAGTGASLSLPTQRCAVAAPSPFTRILLAPGTGLLRRPVSLARVGLLMTAGALPVLSIPLYVFNLLPISASARFLVLPLAVIVIAMALHRSVEARWAVRGFTAGLIAVTAYDALRMPMVYTKIWPDFIPRLGGWIIGDVPTNIPVGYAWRYIGDGGGIGMAFFVLCGAVGLWRFPALARRPILLGIGYGIFVWSGLVATIALSSRGTELLFPLSWQSLGLSLTGHLIYGSVLGIYLRRALATERRLALAA